MAIKTPPKQLYHISPRANRPSIMRLGLSPAFAQAERRKAVWAVEHKALIWAIMHVSIRHDVRPDLLDVYLIAPFKDWRCHQGSIWYSPAIEVPVYWQPAVEIIDGYAKAVGAL